MLGFEVKEIDCGIGGGGLLKSWTGRGGGGRLKSGGGREFDDDWELGVEFDVEKLGL